MKSSKRNRVLDRERTVSSRGFSEPVGPGFSRPTPARGARRRPTGGHIESFPVYPVGVLLELRALALDDQRAQSYLAKPGCNVVLGMAHRARTLVKRSRILRFLRDDCEPNERPVVPSGVAGQWSTPPRGVNPRAGTIAPRRIAGRARAPI